jgi:hypothetical protein
MKAEQRRQNREKSGLSTLFDNFKTNALVKEQLLIDALLFLGKKYYGAIDSQEQDLLFDAFGIHFTPSRNNGDDIWIAELSYL